MDLSEEDSPFIRSRKNTTDVRDSFNLIMDKELEITEAIFDPMPEECFLCLDWSIDRLLNWTLKEII